MYALSAKPACAGSCRHVSVAGSHGPAKPVFCRYWQGKLVNDNFKNECLKGVIIYAFLRKR